MLTLGNMFEHDGLCVPVRHADYAKDKCQPELLT